MYAVIETGGKQYRVQEGDVISVEKLNIAADDKVEFDKVLVISDGDAVKVGTPYVDAVKVFGTVVENGKGDKVIIFKYKAKKDYRKKQGHRQPYTMVRIDSLNGKPAPIKAAAPKEEKEVEAPAKETAKKADKPAAEKKPAVKKATAEKKPAAKKADKPAAEKKPAAKKATKSEE